MSAQHQWQLNTNDSSTPMTAQHQWQLNANARLHSCLTLLQNSFFSRWNLKMASVRPKHVVSNFFISWFLIKTSIRKLLVVLLTASPYRHSGTSCSAVRYSVCLTSLTLWTFKSWEKCFLYLENTVGICNQITHLILSYNSPIHRSNTESFYDY